MPISDTSGTENPAETGCLGLSPTSWFYQKKVRKKAKAIYDDTQKIKALFGFLDGLIISYSTFKLAFDIITPPDQSASDSMHEWMTTGGGASAATAEMLAIIALSMLGNLFDEDAKEPLIRNLALLWPYLRDAFKGFKYAYKGLANVFETMNLFGVNSYSANIFVPIGVVLGLAGMANRIWYRNQVTEPRKEYQKKNNLLLRRAQNLGDGVNYEICEMPASDRDIKHHKIYLKIDEEKGFVEYKVYNPYDELVSGKISIKNELLFTGLDKDGNSTSLSIDQLKDDYKHVILSRTKKNGHTEDTNDEKNRQAIRAAMDGCCSILVTETPTTGKDILKKIHPFDSAYIRIVNEEADLDQLFYYNKQTKSLVLVSADKAKLVEYDSNIISTPKPKVLLTPNFEFIASTLGHTHQETQHLPQPQYAMASAIFGGFVDGLYTFMGAMPLAVMAQPWLAALAVCCGLFTVICIINRAHEEREFQRDFIRSRLNVELVLLSKEIEASFARLQAISEILANEKEQIEIDGKVVIIPLSPQTRKRLEKEGKEVDILLTQHVNELKDKKQKYDELIISDTSRALLTGLRTGLYIYSAISSVVFAIKAICVIAIWTFPPVVLISAVLAGLVSLLASVVYAYHENDVNNNKYGALLMSERPNDDLSNIRFGPFNKGYVRVVNQDTGLDDLFYVDKRENICKQLKQCRARFNNIAPTEIEKNMVRSSDQILFFLDEGSYKVGFLNREGGYEQQEIADPTIIDILKSAHSTSSDSAVYISDTSQIAKINQFLASRCESSTRIYEYSLKEHYDSKIKSTDTLNLFSSELSTEELDEISSLTGHNRRKEDFNEKKLSRLIDSIKKRWRNNQKIVPDPVRERDALLDGLHTDPSPQYHVQEGLEVIRSCFSGLSKGQKAIDYSFNGALEQDSHGQYHDTPWTIVLSLIASVAYAIVYALRAFGKYFRGANDVPLPKPGKKHMVKSSSSIDEPTPSEPQLSNSPDRQKSLKASAVLPHVTFLDAALEEDPLLVRSTRSMGEDLDAQGEPKCNQSLPEDHVVPSPVGHQAVLLKRTLSSSQGLGALGATPSPTPDVPPSLRRFAMFQHRESTEFLPSEQVPEEVALSMSTGVG